MVFVGMSSLAAGCSSLATAYIQYHTLSDYLVDSMPFLSVHKASAVVKP